MWSAIQISQKMREHYIEMMVLWKTEQYKCLCWYNCTFHFYGKSVNTKTVVMNSCVGQLVNVNQIFNIRAVEFEFYWCRIINWKNALNESYIIFVLYALILLLFNCYYYYNKFCHISWCLRDLARWNRELWPYNFALNHMCYHSVVPLHGGQFFEARLTLSPKRLVHYWNQFWISYTPQTGNY